MTHVPPPTPEPPDPLAPSGPPERPRHRRFIRWLPWIFGAALLATVIVVALRFAEARQFLVLVERAQPSWLVVAAVLQAATYLAEGEGWRVVGRAGGAPIPLRVAYRLSLAKLFIDQALPSAGISGTAVFARSLGTRGVPRPVVMAAVVIDLVSYYISYILCLVAALVITLAYGEANAIVVSVASGFILFGAALAAVALVLAGRAGTGLGRRLHRVTFLRRLLALFTDADRSLTQSPSVIAKATLCQLGVFLLDAASLGVLVLAVGGPIAPGAAFAGYMIASLFRTVGIVPGGLGTFEATATLTLDAMGLELPVALAATLIFRGLSFWLPLVPGMIVSRRELREETPRPRP